MNKILPLIIILLGLNSEHVFSQAGTLDQSYSSDGLVFGGQQGSSFASGTDIAIQSDGKIVSVGYVRLGLTTQTIDMAVFRTYPDGTRDSTFGGDGMVTTDIFGNDDYATAVAIQPDGKIVVAGYGYTTSNADYDWVVVRYDQTGALDLSFSLDGKVTRDFGIRNDIASGIALQSDGKILVCGNYETSTNYSKNLAVARYLTNGSPDINFNANGVFAYDFGGDSDNAYDIVVQNDNKSVFVAYSDNNPAQNYILMRLNTTGYLDNSFDGNGIKRFGYSNGGWFSSLAIQPDQKIVAAGFSNDGTANSMLVGRFLSNGSNDSTFSLDGISTFSVTSPTNYCQANDVAIQPDGKIAVTGQNTIGTNTDCAVARLLSDGTPDAAFNGNGTATIPLSSGSEFARGVAVQTDNKIVITGATGISSGSMIIARFISCTSTSSSFTDNGCVQYLWTENNLTYTASGNYSIIYQNASGCDSVRTLQLTIYPEPVTTVNQNNLTLTAAEPNAQYQWLDCNNNNDPIPGATSQSFTASVNGSYRVQISKNGCTVFSECYSVNTIGLENITSAASLSIFPNPAKNHFSILSDSQPTCVEILDISGKSILKTTNLLSNSCIDISSLSSGLYLVRLVLQNGSVRTERLIRLD